MSKLSRRSFVAGSAATALMGMAANAWADAAPVAADDIQFDTEVDVLVLGLGGAGANAAVAAYEEGAKVLVCEKAPEGQEPCNTKASGQFVMATDDAEGLYAYLSQLMGKFQNWDEEALMGYCQGCQENFAWMTGPMGGDIDVIYMTEESGGPGALFPNEGRMGDAWAVWDDPWGVGRKGYVYTWDEFPEIPESKHCLCLTATGTRFDAGYYNLCMAAVNARVDDDKLTIWRGCPGKRLIVKDGEVLGAVVEKDGAEVNVRAKGGVCLCTGGMEANPDMMSDFTQIPYCYLQAGTMNTGDGIRMAEQAGAQLWHMSNVSGFNWAYQSPYLSTCSSMGYGFNPKGIFAGESGKRYMNEAAPTRHGRIDVGGRWISTPMSLPTYYIIDSANIGEKMNGIFSDGNVDELADGQIICGETIEELSANIRAIGEAPAFNLNGELDSALEKYNRHCHANDGAGEEDDFCRMCTVPVETGPFYALKIGPTMYNTQGGPRRNQYAQVIGFDGYPIPGLFVGGEMGSVFADMYNGSGNLGETMVFGRYAGKNAALRAKGEFEGATEQVLTHSQKLAAAAAADVVDYTTVALADGVYVGAGKGYGGSMQIQVTVEGGKITACEVLENAETPTIGGQALPVYCEDLVATGDPAAIDIASGASNTLRGFVACCDDVFAQASA